MYNIKEEKELVQEEETNELGNKEKKTCGNYVVGEELAVRTEGEELYNSEDA